MNVAMHEVVLLVSEYYLEYSQYGDQYEIQAIQEAAEQGLDALNTMCHRLWGHYTLDVYQSILSSIRDYFGFFLDNYEVSSIWLPSDIDIILDMINRRAYAAEYICTMWTSSLNGRQSAICKHMLDEISHVTSRIRLIFEIEP